jgi:short-chain Z-isoprenyl diphosphate synthase
MRLTKPLYALYTRRLRKQLAGAELPDHVGLIMDGNRRWARQQGLTNPSLGHHYGAEHAERVLSRCESLGIRYVTVFLCSTENLTNRADGEVAFLMDVVERLATDRLARPGARRRVHVAGAIDLLPTTTARALKHAAEATRTARPAPTSPWRSATAAAKRSSTASVTSSSSERPQAARSPRSRKP